MNLNIRKRKRTFPQNNFWRKVLIFNRFLSGIVQRYPSVAPIILHINLRICCSKRCSKPTSYPLKPLILLVFISPTTSSSGIFLIAKLTLVYPCKPLGNRLSRILYTWSLLDVFLTFVRLKDVIRLKIRLFILRHVLPCQTLQY